MAVEKSKIIVDASNLPTAAEIRDTRIRVTAASGKVYDLVFLVDENPPDVTIHIGVTGQPPGLSFTGIFGAIDDAIQGDESLAEDFIGKPGLVLEDRTSGDTPDIRVIGGNGKITVATVQQGA